MHSATEEITLTDNTSFARLCDAAAVAEAIYRANPTAENLRAMQAAVKAIQDALKQK
jgi:hypothetical protein